MPCFGFNPTGHLERDTLVSACCAWDIAKVRWWKSRANSAFGGIVDIYSTAYPDPLRVEFSATPSNPSVFRSGHPKVDRQDQTGLGATPRELIRPEDAPMHSAPLTADAEWHAPSVYGAMDSLLDYFPQPPVLVLDQPDTLKAHTAECWQAIEEGTCVTKIVPIQTLPDARISSISPGIRFVPQRRGMRPSP